MTFGVDIAPAALSVVSRLATQIKPVLTLCFLRWALNSIPTASRLHDNGFNACPFCGEPDIRSSHLIVCHGVWHSAVERCLSCIDRIRVPVSESNALCISLATPPTASMFVSARLGLDVLSISELKLRWQVLYLIQYAFISLRSRCRSLNLSSDDSRAELCNAFNAALSTLGH